MLKFLFIILIFSSNLYSNHKVLDQEIDSLKNLVYSDIAKDTREYHTNVIELYRKYRYFNNDSAKYYLKYGVELSSHYKLDLVTRDYYNIMGLDAFDKSDFSSALVNFYKCLEYSVKTNEIGAVGYTYSDIGFVFYVQGLWDLALEHYQEGIRFIKDADSLETISLPLLYENSGLCFGHLNQIDSANHYLNLALEYYKKHDIQDKVHHIYLYLGHINRRHVKDNKKALEYYYLALNFFKEDRSWLEGYPYTLFHTGESYFALKEYDKTIEYYKTTLLEMKKLGWNKKIIDINFKLAYVYLELNKIDKVDSVININDELIKQFESIDLFMDKYYFQYNYFKKLNNSDSALLYFEKYNKLKDSLVESSVTGQVASVLKDLQIVKNKQERKMLAEKNEQKMYLFLFIIILFIFLIVLIYSRLRLQKKSLILQNEKNEALEKANKLLDEANHTKDKFFSIIAHDLKNPIGAIKSTSELLTTDYDMFDKNEIKESIEDIYNSSNSVQSLLDSLLTWSRSQRGKLDFNPETFNLQLLVKNSFFLLKSNSDLKKISLINNISDDYNIIADANMINTIIRNLISNAIKFTPENGKITISAYKENNNNVITIEDTGIGISKENQNKLFNFGTNYTTPGTNNEKGTGLGLILVNEFIERHNGKIAIESEINKGTKFIITLPNEK